MAESAGSGLRLLVVDEAIALGGVERMCVSLMPELAKRCENLVWMLPQHRLDTMQAAMPRDAKVQFESFHWPKLGAGRLVNAAGLRMAEAFGSTASLRRMEQRLEVLRLRSAARAHRSTHVLYPALFRQRFPQVPLPVFAGVMDVNYHPSIDTECFANLKLWVRKASRLISISDFTRAEIARLHPESSAKVLSIPIASDGNVPAQGGAATVPPRTGRPTLYYPASFNPHKGHAVLLEAVRLLLDQGTDVGLMLTGSDTRNLLSPAPLEHTELEKARSTLMDGPTAFRERIEIRGLVSTSEVEVCFAEANLVVLPSRYEGFGLPLAEAVARGKRVICSDIPAFREQVRLYGFERAVTFVPSETASAWADAIRRGVADSTPFPYSPAELRVLFARWTWADVARRYTEALNAA